MKLFLSLMIFRAFFAMAAELPKPVVPNPEAFLGWTNKPYVVDELDFEKLETKAITCLNRAMTPLSRDQTTKKYHHYVIGRYDHSKLRGDSEACAVTSITGYCLRPDTVEFTIMSDTYIDSCGNKYRGFWKVLFLTRHENMGTLSSLGRTFYEKPNSPGEIEIGPVYRVDASEFLFFTEL